LGPALVLLASEAFRCLHAKIEREGGGWELHYEDGSGRVIPAASLDFTVQGEFVAILPQNAVPEGRTKGPGTHEEPLENR
jgi:hypothetical protein